MTGKGNRIQPELARKHFQHPEGRVSQYSLYSNNNNNNSIYNTSNNNNASLPPSSFGQFTNASTAVGGNDMMMDDTDGSSVYGLQQKTLYISFKFSLLGAMCTLILSPILLLTIISITFSLITANQIENLVVTSAVEKANTYVSNYLDTCIILASAQRQQVFDDYYMKYTNDALFYSPQNYQAIFKILARTHSQHRSLVFLMDFTPPNGDYLYVNSVDSSEYPNDNNLPWSQQYYEKRQKLFFVFNPSSNSTYLDTYQMSKNGTFIALTKKEDYPSIYDPRNDEYYKLSLIHEKAITPIALQVADYVEEQVYVSYQESIYSPFNSSKYIGVVSTTVVIKQLVEFVQSFKFSTNGILGIIELNKNGDGTYRKRVIAYRDLKTLVIQNTDGSLSIPEADEIPNEMLRYIVVNIIPSTTEKVYAGRKSLNRFYYGSVNLMSFDVVSSSEGFNVEWLVFISAPETDFIGNLLLMSGLNVVVSVIFVIVSIVIAYYISVKISRPLGYFSNESKAISRLEVNRSLPLKTKIREIIELGEAFDKMKTTLRSFMRFVPKHLIVEMVEKGIEMKLGGAMLDNITILFSDVENFTTWSEELPPQLLITHVSEYFHVMTEEIVNEQGTLDKYIGDSVMALWGAPSAMMNTALPACRAAIKCQKAMRRLREKWDMEGKPLFRCRIGLHTGSCIVGNIGSVWRLNYTCMGDAVNLASRLEGQNKVYGTEVMISESTAQQPEIFETFTLRKLDKVSVKGKSVGCTVYELQSKNLEYSSTFYAKGEKATFIQKYESALDKYFDGSFDQAHMEFTACGKMFKGDKATQTMIERCNYYIENPPANWTGVHVASEK